MKSYMDSLYEEYIESKNGRFEDWLIKEQEMIKYYEAFLETMDFIPRRGVVEFDKGKYNSLVNNLYEGIGILVSKEKIEEKKNTRCIDGKIIINKNDILLEYNNIKSNLNFINFFITQFPTNQDRISLLANLVLKNKSIFIGTYGNLKDIDKQDKLKKLYLLKQELQTYLGKNFEGEKIETSDYFFATITPKYKYKKIN